MLAQRGSNVNPATNPPKELPTGKSFISKITIIKIATTDKTNNATHFSILAFNYLLPPIISIFMKFQLEPPIAIQTLFYIK